MSSLLIKSKIVVVVLLFSTIVAFTQNFNTKVPLCRSCEKELSIKFESTSFFKNNEYFNKFTKGFTGIGYFAKPTLQYFFTKTTKVNAGVFLEQFSGLDKFSKVIPIFSVQQNISNNFDIVIGSLYGTLNHGLAEPLFRFDRYYQNNVEYGLQGLYNSKFLDADVWLNWENYIFKNDTSQEAFQAGSVFDFKVFEKPNFKINIPLQLLVYHKGGQIDISNEPITTLFNGDIGLRFEHQIKTKNNLTYEALFFWYDALAAPKSGPNSQLFKHGYAWYYKIKHRIKNFNYSIGYWNANKFTAPKGEYLFLSISENNSTFSEAKRSLITAKAAYTYKVSKSVKIEVKADGYYDTLNNNFDYNYGLYLLLNEDFFIKKLHY